ncbi:cysteine hydrolase family protein [Bordetella sp. BOR01]|uniref:cysteine hydrolase family protein n=1 Tax=Bordetella sp. BOR01 TaxID=2854779 RepID=UPI001C472FF9|nr:cysteine hydrolase family protein [Bordetella sp. BOR01]MBV7486428.1 cysteine hydrolase [Bordetella sp. BOR01]
MSCALLIVDVQEALFGPQPRPADADAIVARINALAARARREGVAVIHIQHDAPGGELARGSEGWQLFGALERLPVDHVVGKTTPDSFLRTGLDALLKQLQVSRVAICGYATEFCVDTTVRQAAARGYDVVLVADAHTTHDKPHAGAAAIRTHHNMTLPAISSFGPRIEAIAADQIMLTP